MHYLVLGSEGRGASRHRSLSERTNAPLSGILRMITSMRNYKHPRDALERLDLEEDGA
jgi:hypothetical protein